MTNKKENVQGLKVYTSHPYESVKTCFLVLTWIILGIHLEIVGPTLNVLADQCQVSLSQISTILVTRNGGYMIANLIGATLQRYVEKYPEGLLSISFLVASIVVISTPLINSLIAVAILFFFQGISQGVTDLGGTSLMLRMWGDNVAAPLNIVHLGYGIGAVFSNLIVKPFLSETNSREFSNIQIPYSIISLLCLIIFVIHLIYSIREYQKREETKKDRPIEYTSVSSTEVKQVCEKESLLSRYSPSSCGYGSFSYGLLMSIIWTFYMFFLSGNDQTFGKFFFVFLKSEQFQISTNGATWGLIIYWLSYSVGRLICALVTVFVPVHIAISVLWIFGFILASTWYIVVWLIGLTSTKLFVLGAFTGLVFSPIFPLSFAFLNQRLNVNPLLVAILLTGSAFGGMVFQRLGGTVLEQNVKHFPTLLITCIVLAVLLFLAAFILSTIQKKKTTQTKTKIEEQINEEEQQMETYLNENQ